jgi:hypothetical protein
MKSLDWNATKEKAKGMLNAELIFAIKDCGEAAVAADSLEKAGALGYNSKSGGYYLDEASVYTTEVLFRIGQEQKKAKKSAALQVSA